MLEEALMNPKRRSLTFADKFEVKFFFKAEAPKEIAFCETSFTNSSDSYYVSEDDYWDTEDSYEGEEEEEDYYDDDEEERNYHRGRYYYSSNPSSSSSYYDYGQDPDYGYPLNNYGYDYGYDYDYHELFSRNYHSYSTYTDNEDFHYGYEEEEEGPESPRGREEEDRRGRHVPDASERSTTRRLALAKLEKGLFRRQQLRDSETYSETEESEVSLSTSESDNPFDEPLPPRRITSSFTSPVTTPTMATTPPTSLPIPPGPLSPPPSPTPTELLCDMKCAAAAVSTPTPVTIKTTFTSQDLLPGSVPIPNHSGYAKGRKGRVRSRSLNAISSSSPFRRSYDPELEGSWRKDWSVLGPETSDLFQPSSLSFVEMAGDSPFSGWKESFLSSSPSLATLQTKGPSVLTLSSLDRDRIKELLTSTPLSTSKTISSPSFTASPHLLPLSSSPLASVTLPPAKSSKGLEVSTTLPISTVNSNDLVKTMASTHHLLSSTVAATTHSTKSSTAKANPSTSMLTQLLLSNLNTSTANTGRSHSRVKKRLRSYSSPSSLQQLLPCY